MEVSMSITRRGKYTDSNICTNVQVRDCCAPTFLAICKLADFSYPVRGKSLSFYRGKVRAENQNAKHKLAQNGEVCTDNVKRLEIKVLAIVFWDKIRRKKSRGKVYKEAFPRDEQKVILHALLLVWF